MAQLAQTSPSQLSRIERGSAGAGDDLLLRLAEALAVPVMDIIRVEGAPSEGQRPSEGGQGKPTVSPGKLRRVGRREVPYPGTPEGAHFHYTPEEAADFLPWSALQLRRRAYARRIPFNEGGARVSFTGLNICEISAMTAVRPLAEATRSHA